MPNHEEWSRIKAAREMQNLPDGPASPWLRLCLCGHPMRSHRLDYDDAMAGLAPECGTAVRVCDPDTLEVHAGPCPCPEFEPRR